MEQMPRTYLRIPRGRDGGDCGGSARSGERDLVVPNERRATQRCAANAPSLRVAHQPPAGCVNRLGESYGYHLHLAPCLQTVGAATRLVGNFEIGSSTVNSDSTGAGI